MPVETLTLNPAVVRWSLESRGWDVAELAEKSNVPESVIMKIQSERSPIEVRQLERISKCIKQPLAVFFLPEPPREPKLINYRRVQGKAPQKLSKETLDKIRISQYWQSISRALLEERSASLQPDVKRYSLKHSPESAACDERKHLGFNPHGMLFGAKMRPNEFYKALRDRIESRNVFVYQLSMDISDARGIYLTEQLPATIIVNSSDSYEPKIFTLLHEYAHVLLHTNGYCMSSPELPTRTSRESGMVEEWCNAFAGSFLMPKQEFLERASMLEEESDDAERVIKKLSAYFVVSRQAVAVRLMRVNPKSRFSKQYAEYCNKYKDQNVQESRGGGYSKRYDLCLNQRGRKFVSLIFDSYDRSLITKLDVIDYLELHPKNFAKLQEELVKTDPSFGRQPSNPRRPEK